MTREEAIKWFKENPFYNENHKPFSMAIEALQTDAVRCKDCKFGQKKKSKEFLFVCNCLEGLWVCQSVKPNDFCSYGERREK